jgi:hypothetical protein
MSYLIQLCFKLNKFPLNTLSNNLENPNSFVTHRVTWVMEWKCLDFADGCSGFYPLLLAPDSNKDYRERKY